MVWNWQDFEACSRFVFAHNKDLAVLKTPLFKGHNPKTLTHSCVSKFVSISSNVKVERGQVPTIILRLLAKESIQRSNLTVFSNIVEIWPDRLLDVPDIQEPFESSELYRSEDVSLYKKERIALNHGISMSLLHAVRRSRLYSIVEFVDLSGYPISCELLFDFTRGCSESEVFLKLLTIRADFYLTSDFLKDCFRIYRSSRTSKVRIVVRNIYTSMNYNDSRCNWEQQYLNCLKIFLSDSEFIDLTYVEGIELSRLGLRSLFATQEPPSFFSHLLVCYRNLEAIDLSYNAINLNGDMSSCTILKNFLDSYPKLERLSLSGNRLRNNVSILLENVVSLVYLNLSGTHMRVNDISFLAKLVKLEHLDLSENFLRNKINALTTAFKALDNVAVLELEDCGLTEVQLGDLLPVLKQMPALQLLNLKANDIPSVEVTPFSVLLDPLEEVTYLVPL